MLRGFLWIRGGGGPGGNKKPTVNKPVEKRKRKPLPDKPNKKDSIPFEPFKDWDVLKGEHEKLDLKKQTALELSNASDARLKILLDAHKKRVEAELASNTTNQSTLNPISVNPIPVKSAPVNPAPVIINPTPVNPANPTPVNTANPGAINPPFEDLYSADG